jgi:hypothetical protein
VDTLITAGIAANRAEAVRWALARVRERPAYAQLRERISEIDRLKAEFWLWRAEPKVARAASNLHGTARPGHNIGHVMGTARVLEGRPCPRHEWPRRPGIRTRRR